MKNWNWSKVLSNGSKENVITQLVVVGVMLGAYALYENLRWNRKIRDFEEKYYTGYLAAWKREKK